MELAANDRLIVKNILVQQVGFLGDASERAKDNTELLTLTAEMLDALKMIVLFDARRKKTEEPDFPRKMIALKSLRSPLIRAKAAYGSKTHART